MVSDGSYEGEFRVSLSAGQTRWVAARGQVERDTSGKPILLRGVVLDVSARRGIEAELQQLRSQLAHASRVSMMGQLASALAHELSQPLGAILRNTEAAGLFLQHDPPDLDELQAILVDIRQDEQRAGSVIKRLRAAEAPQHRPSRAPGERAAGKCGRSHAQRFFDTQGAAGDRSGSGAAIGDG
ncbi:MAG: PAS domain-containing protein [Burkholderiales bacterium]